MVKPYVQALLMHAQAKQQAARVAKDLQWITKTCEGAPVLAKMLCNPTLKHKEQQKIVKALFAPYICAITWHWLQLLMVNKRLNQLDNMMASYTKAFQAATHGCTIHMTTAVPLSKMRQEKYARLLQQKMGYTAVKLINHVEPAIIGGFILQISDQRIDASLQGTLQQLHAKLIPTLL